MNGHRFPKAKCFHCCFQTAPAVSALALTYLTIFPLSQQPMVCPCVPTHTPPSSSLLLPPSCWQRTLRLIWDSCFQQRHPWQVDSSLPASSWVAGFRPLSSQNESCLLRARAGWLRAHTSCTTQLLTGAGIDTGKKLKLPLSFAVLQQVCTCPLRKYRTDFTTCVTTLSEIPQEETHR